MNFGYTVSLTGWFKDRFESIKSKSWKLTKNKSLEIELLKTMDLFQTTLVFTTRQDHAGLMIEHSLLGWTFSINIYDNRHWNVETNSWQTYGDLSEIP